jgi:D-alanyl-D-alanine carboxypeptidase/D-alanyl-D-alanine-endopeptidase (penicillin-binding protein 4)
MAEGDRRHSQDPADGAPAGRRRRLRRWVVSALVVAVVAAVSGVAFLALTEEPADPRRDPAAVPPPPGLELPEPERAGPVATRLLAGEVDPEAVRRAIGRLPQDPRLGGRVAVAVGTLGGGEPAYAEGPAVVVPASTLKLLTAVAALEVLGPERTFATRSVLDGTTLTLVGGGDPLLTRRSVPGEYPHRADLATLARRTARGLVDRGVRRVALSYDTMLFTGPAVNPRWEPDYVTDDVVSPISALWVDEGREEPGLADRSAQPSATAAAVFAGALADNGIEVTGRPRPGPATPAAEQVAQVRSAEVVELVQHLLETSDNEATEVLARHVALAEGEQGSFAGATRALVAVAGRLGVRTQGSVLRDASGLSRSDRLPVRTLLDLLAVAADPERPALAAAVAGLPVAGWSGSLDDRFTGTDASPPEGFATDMREALGDVRAKTGTLTGVNGLAGVITGRDGTVMTFVAQMDRVPVDYTFLARDRLDRIGAALAACACGARPAAP